VGLARQNVFLKGATRLSNPSFTPLANVDTAGKALALWHNQVMKVSKRLLSFKTDRHLDISVAARHVRAVTGSQNLASLRRDGLIHITRWKHHIAQNVKWKATRAWHAPTRSWTSVVVGVFCNDDSISAKGPYINRAIETLPFKQSTQVYGQVVDG
jgi:hypothetical protein